MTRGTQMKTTLALWALVAALSGCSMATLGTAAPVDRGETQLLLAPGFMRVGLSGSVHPGPQLEVGGRHGITDRVDLGARLWLPLPGYVVDSRILLKRAASKDRGVDISLNPGLMYIYAPGGDNNSTPLHFTTVQMAALFGWRIGGGKQVVLAPKVSDIISVDPSTSFGSALNMVVGGASLGLVWPLWRGFALVPELAAGTVLSGSVSGFGSSDVGNNGNVLQFSLGMLFGGERAPEQRCVEVPPPADPTPPAD